MAIRIGGASIINGGKTTDDTTVDEIRFVNNHSRFSDCLLRVKHNIGIGKFVIANIDLYDRLENWHPSEQEIRDFANHTISNLILFAGAKPDKCRITVGNEPMRMVSKETYARHINIVCDELKNKRKYKFSIGAGNEEFSLANKYGMYEYIMTNCPLLDYLDIHLQAALINTKTKRVDENRLNIYANQAKMLAQNYRKKLSCTEANWMDISKKEGYQDLLKVLIKAEEIGCEDFCMVFISLSDWDKYEWLSFIHNDRVRSPYWNDFKRIIKEKKPKPKLIIGDYDMKLQNLKIGSKGNQVLWLQEILEIEYGIKNQGGFDGIFGLLTDKQVKEYQEKYNITIDGVVGKETTWKLIEEADYPEYWFKKLVIYMSYE